MTGLPDDGDGDRLPAGELDARTAALQASVTGLVARPCRSCGAALCAHEGVLAVVLGSKHEPHCARCLAVAQREPLPSLAERALQWILRRDCFLHVWRRASADEGHGDAERPPCLFGAAAAAAAAVPVSFAADAANGGSTPAGGGRGARGRGPPAPPAAAGAPPPRRRPRLR